MSYPNTSIRKFVFGLSLSVFTLFACNNTFAIQEETPEANPVETLDPREAAVPTQQETPESTPDPSGLDEPIVLPDLETVPEEMPATTPVESLDLSEGAVVPQHGNADGSLEVPPPAALVTDPVGSASAAEKAELSDIVGDSIARDAAGKIVAQDISLESTNEAIESRKAKLALGANGSSGDESAAGVGASAKDPFLSPKHIGWLWKLIWIALAIGFLLWLLSLMSAKAKRAKEAAAKPSSSDKPSKRNPTAANSLAAGSATAGSASAGTASAESASAESASAGSASAESASAGSASAESASADVNVGDIGSVFARRPEVVDDLTKIGGIDAAAEKRLNEAGIWQYDQLRSMNAQQRANLQRKLNLPRIRWYSLSGLGGASASVAAASGLDASKDVRVDSGNAAASLGAAANAASSVPPPKFRGAGAGQGTTTASSATTVGGVGAAAAAGAAGIAGFAGRGGQSNGSASSSTTSSVPRSNDPTGFVYTSKPADADDLSKLDGIDAAAAKRLNEAGIYKFEQLDQLDDQQKATVADRCQLGGFKFAQCFPKIGRSDASLGFVYTEAPRDADDLTRLAGIDAAAAKRLNEAGIYKFDQLENLNDNQTAELAKRFNLPEADPSDWKRCFYAWGRGINTSAEVDQVFENGLLNGVELPQFAEGVFDGEKLSVQNEQIIFRGSNPEGWGTGNTGIEGVETSLNCDDIRSDINYLRIRRTDTQESVVLPMTKGLIFSNGDPATSGWNGSSEVFFGGRHVGAFAQHLPQEVETKFSQGGWGFGHRYDHNDRQEWGWGGRVIEPTTMEVSVGCLGKTPGTLVFRGSDPSIWNTQNSGENGFAIPISSVDHPVHFVRIMRQATGEAIIVRVDGNHILDEGFDPRCGWNGSSAQFSGGVHLGAYHCDLPQDFETRFEFGGWGFGHPYDDNDRQAWGWAGRQLPETTFEISLLESVPSYMQHEVLS